MMATWEAVIEVSEIVLVAVFEPIQAEVMPIAGAKTSIHWSPGQEGGDAVAAVSDAYSACINIGVFWPQLPCVKDTICSSIKRL